MSFDAIRRVSGHRPRATGIRRESFNTPDNDAREIAPEICFWSLGQDSGI